MVSFRFIRFIRARCRVHPGSMGSFGRSLVASGSFGFIRARVGGSLGSFLHALVLLGFNWVRSRGRRFQLCSSSSFGLALHVVQFIRARCCGRRVHLGSLGLFGNFGFIRLRSVHSGTP